MSLAPETSSAGTRRRLPLGVTVLGLALLAALVAAGGAAVLEAGFGAGTVGAAFWGAALGVWVVALPAVAMALRRARAAPAAPVETRDTVDGSGPVTPRALFFQLAEREWARARRYNTGVALLLVDIDRYARLCETHGAPTGANALDELLRQTAATLRGADALTRLADGQMAVFLAQADATGALDVAERIRERAERLILGSGGMPLSISVSVGVAHLRPAHPHLQALVEDAKDALAGARQAGGNCVRAAPLESDRVGLAGGWRPDRRTPRQQPRP